MKFMITQPNGYDPRDIANIILDLADGYNIEITHTKLQKLLFFCHGAVWAKLKQDLIFSPFKAWEHGPVQRVIYDQFKSLKYEPIKKRAMKLNIETDEREIASAPVSGEMHDVIVETIKWLGPLTANQLVEMSHANGSAWDKVRNSDSNQVFFAQEIPAAWIKENFHSDHSFAYNLTPA